jgi:hypothetical protein
MAMPYGCSIWILQHIGGAELLRHAARSITRHADVHRATVDPNHQRCKESAAYDFALFDRFDRLAARFIATARFAPAARRLRALRATFGRPALMRAAPLTFSYLPKPTRLTFLSLCQRLSAA